MKRNKSVFKEFTDSSSVVMENRRESIDLEV